MTGAKDPNLVHDWNRVLPDPIRDVADDIEAELHAFWNGKDADLFLQAARQLRNVPPDSPIGPAERIPFRVPLWVLQAKHKEPLDAVPLLVADQEGLRANTVAVWANYMAGPRQIYCCHPAFIASLHGAPWPNNVPPSALRLPVPCPIFAFYDGGEMHYVACTAGPDDPENPEDSPEIRFSVFQDGDWILFTSFYLDAETLAAGALRAVKRHLDARDKLASTYKAEMALFKAELGLEPGALFRNHHNETTGLLLNLLLYLAGQPDPDLTLVGQASAWEPDDAMLDHPGMDTFRAAVPRTAVYAVGPAFQAAWEERQSRDHQDQIKPSPCPPAAAHPVLYYRDEDHTRPAVRYDFPELAANTQGRRPEPKSIDGRNDSVPAAVPLRAPEYQEPWVSDRLAAIGVAAIEELAAGRAAHGAPLGIAAVDPRMFRGTLSLLCHPDFIAEIRKAHPKAVAAFDRLKTVDLEGLLPYLVRDFIPVAVVFGDKTATSVKDGMRLAKVTRPDLDAMVQDWFRRLPYVLHHKEEQEV